MPKTLLTPREDQIAALTFYFSQPRCGNFSEPGVGKTLPTCLYTFARCTRDGAKAIWIQPGSLLKKNYEELQMCTPFEPEDLGLLTGTPKQKLRVLARKPNVLITTADTFASYATRIPGEYQLLVGDEWHLLFKGHKSCRTESLNDFMPTRKWLVAMTGTMIHGRADSAYPWIRLVEPRYYASHDAFVRQHATLDPWDGKIVGWKRNLPKLAEIFARHSVRFTRTSVYGPDAIVRQVEWVDMSSLQRARYDEYHEKALIELENGKIVESGSPFSMARAILEHPEAVPEYELVFDGERATRVRTGWTDLMKGETSGKDEQLLIHVEDHLRDGTPFVYFGALQRQLERVHKLLNSRGVKAGLIHGGVPNPQRVKVDEAFRAGELQAIVASPDTAGVGFNWQFQKGLEVDHCIFGSLPPMDTSLTQAESRFCRQTRSTPLRSTILGYRKSLDKRIFELVERKSGEAAAVDPTREVFNLRRVA